MAIFAPAESLPSPATLTWINLKMDGWMAWLYCKCDNVMVVMVVMAIMVVL